MSRTLTVSIPHRLSQDEARSRIQKGIADLRQKFGDKVANVDERWTANHLDFKLTAMGQAISGRADVGAEAVRLEVDLPWMLSILADRIKPRVIEEGRRMLENKP